MYSCPNFEFLSLYCRVIRLKALISDYLEPRGLRCGSFLMLCHVLLKSTILLQEDALAWVPWHPRILRRVYLAPISLCNKMDLWGYFHVYQVQIEFLDESYLKFFPDSGQFRFNLNFLYLLLKSWRNLTKRSGLFAQKLEKDKSHAKITKNRRL